MPLSAEVKGAPKSPTTSEKQLELKKFPWSASGYLSEGVGLAIYVCPPCQLAIRNFIAHVIFDW